SSPTKLGRCPRSGRRGHDPSVAVRRRHLPSGAGEGTRRRGGHVMAVTIRQAGPCFAGEVAGIDMARPLTPDEVAAIHAGMDRYAVLVFRDQQHIDDAQQLAFTRSLGEIEHAIGTSLRAAQDYRLPTTFADVSNLDKNDTPFARDDRRRLFAI